MRRIPTACFSSVAAGLIAAAPASASDHDEQVWTSATATTALSPKVDTTLELHSRYTDDVSRVGQVLIRPSVTYKLPRGWSVTAGYVYVRTRFENTAANDEHRSWGRLREGAESYAKLAQIAGARSYLLLPSTVAPERRRLSSIRRWLRILKVSGPTRRYSMKPRERQNRSAASFASSTANRISVAPLAAAQLSTVE